MCDVPSIAVFCSESIECVPGRASKFIIIIIIIIDGGVVDDGDDYWWFP